MPVLCVGQLRPSSHRSWFRALIVLGFFSLLGVGGCALHSDKAEQPIAPPMIVAAAGSPGPLVGSPPPIPPWPVLHEQTTKSVRTTDRTDEEVQRAIQNATHVVGIETVYLMVVAERESHFDPRKCAHRTSATGLYQFTENTWLRAVRAFGARHGLEAYAEKISVSRRGAVSMDDDASRMALLRLRADPRISALMAAELARDNAARLAHILRRPVRPAEIYIAHLFGVTQAARVIEMARSAPHTPGARLLPAAARTNPTLFQPLGRMASAGAIVERITVDYQRQEASLVHRLSSKAIVRATG